MNKKDVKIILMSMRTQNNEERINKLLGKIDMLDEETLQKAIQKVGGTEEDVKVFFESKLKEQSTHQEEHTPINAMFSYGISDTCIHLHFPNDLHDMISQQGISRTIDLANLYLLDAIDRIKQLKSDGFYRFSDKDSIYMISHALIGSELEFLSKLDFKTRRYNSRELKSEDFLRNNPEANLAVQLFGNDKRIGTAKIDIDTIFSDEWQEKKQGIVQRLKDKGITLNNEKSEEKCL